ncbi:MAG TPA: hypothetical protein VHK01_13740 [Lacipirellulaceae bacterium]|nr:hypothetical protein [Lacipirellulaceae bacterium]
MESASAGVVIAWVMLHALALASAWGTRVATGSRMESVLQLAFLAAMAIVGAAALVGRQIDIDVWPASAVTLMVMVIMAVIDVRRAGETAHVA